MEFKGGRAAKREVYYDKKTSKFKKYSLYTVYYYYKSQLKYPSLKKVTKYEYSKIVSEFNQLLSKELITSGKAYKVPFIGVLYLTRRRLEHNNYKYKYNYAETIKEGVPVQFDTAHSSHFIYHIRWHRTKLKQVKHYFLKTIPWVGRTIKKAVMDKTVKCYI